MRFKTSFAECSRVSKIIVAIPLALGLFSTGFFLFQGGFGGGHGVYDLLVFANAVLSLPLIVLMERTGIYSNSDFLNMILLPFLWNLGLSLGIIRMIEGRWVGLKIWFSKV